MTTKNVYSRNNNVCLGVCMMVFMRILSIKKGYVMVFLCVLLLLKIIFSMKSDIGIFGNIEKCVKFACLLFESV